MTSVEWLSVVGGVAVGYTVVARLIRNRPLTEPPPEDAAARTEAPREAPAEPPRPDA